MRDVNGKVFKDHQLVLFNDLATLANLDTISISHKFDGHLYASRNTHLVNLNVPDEAYPFTVVKDNAIDDDLLKAHKEGKNADLGTLDDAWGRIAYYMAEHKKMQKLRAEIAKYFEKYGYENKPIERLYMLYCTD